MKTVTPKDIFSLAAEVVTLARKRDIRIGTAESCTGGLIGAAITAIPGSSISFKGGIIAYDNAVKMSHLSVAEDVLNTYGAVSEEVAIAMAAGAVNKLPIDLAVSVTGVAGPDGGSETKPVGTVWIGVAQKGLKPKAKLHNFGDVGRNQVRDVTCYEALAAIKSVLSET